MSTIRSLDDLNRLRQAALERKLQEAENGVIQVIVSLGSCGIAAGAQETLEAFQRLLGSTHSAPDKGLHKVHLWKTGCNGQCRAEPLVWVVAPGQRKIAYANVTPARAERIITQHLLEGKIVHEFVLE